MIVDPSTGMPISITQPGSFAAGAFGEVGINAETNPGLLASFSHTPNAITTMGWNSFRGGNTILRGGWSSNELNRGTFLKNQFMPRSFGRMSSIYGVDNSNAPRVARSWPRKGTKRPYSPLNMLGSDDGKFNPNGVFNWINKKRNPEAETQRFFSPGFMSRQNAAQRIIGGRTNFQAADVINNVSKLDPEFAKAMSPLSGSLDDSGLAHMVGASMQGQYSLKASGYLTGARAKPLNAAEREVYTEAGKGAYLEGSDRAVSSLAKGGLSRVSQLDGVGTRLAYHEGEAGVEKFGFSAAKAGIREAFGVGLGAAEKEAAGVGIAAGLETVGVIAAGTLGMATGVTEAVLAAKLAYDVTKMFSGAATSAMQTAKDAAISFKGDIGKPIMGMGYKDNSVAATSRSRGVAAIQNSRLNARSALGSEASSLFAHFG